MSLNSHHLTSNQWKKQNYGREQAYFQKTLEKSTEILFHEVLPPNPNVIKLCHKRSGLLVSKRLCAK